MKVTPSSASAPYELEFLAFVNPFPSVQLRQSMQSVQLVQFLNPLAICAVGAIAAIVAIFAVCAITIAIACDVHAIAIARAGGTSATRTTHPSAEGPCKRR